MTRVQVVDPEEKRLEVIVEDTQLSRPSVEGPERAAGEQIGRLEY